MIIYSERKGEKESIREWVHCLLLITKERHVRNGEIISRVFAIINRNDQNLSFGGKLN